MSKVCGQNAKIKSNSIVQVYHHSHSKVSTKSFIFSAADVSTKMLCKLWRLVYHIDSRFLSISSDIDATA